MTTRRNFFKSAALTTLMFSSTGIAFAEQPTELPKKWDAETDVLVAGSGIAGMTAAIEAIDHGAKTIVLEKGKNYGGCAYVSGGILKLEGGTRTQKAHGMEDTPEQLYKRVTNPANIETKKNDKAIAKVFSEMLPGCQVWLEDKGVKFLDSMDKNGRDTQHLGTFHHIWWSEPGLALPKPQPGGGFMTGMGIMVPLKDYFEGKGGQILMEHKLLNVYRDASGKVVGAKVQTADGKILNIKANKGVVLAGGSWKANKALRKLTDPRFGESMFASGWPYVEPDGSAILAGLMAGGMFVADRGEDTGHLRRKFGTTRYNWCKGSPYGYPGIEIGGKRWADVIFTNKDGDRFCNEKDTPYTGQPWFYDYALDQPDQLIWVIFDDATAKKYRWVLEAPVCEPGCALVADTLEELAAQTKQPNLAKTVARYNGFVEAKKDDDFNKPTEMLKTKIEKGPFHAVRCTLGVHNLTGGLRINDKSQVLDLEGKPIKGLYAAGETSGGFAYGGQARCIVTGRLAGIDATTGG